MLQNEKGEIVSEFESGKLTETFVSLRKSEEDFVGNKLLVKNS